MCYLESDNCQKGSNGCTIQDIQDTSKENGATDISIYENEVTPKNKM